MYKLKTAQLNSNVTFKKTFVCWMGFYTSFCNFSALLFGHVLFCAEENLYVENQQLLNLWFLFLIRMTPYISKIVIVFITCTVNLYNSSKFLVRIWFFFSQINGIRKSCWLQNHIQKFQINVTSNTNKKIFITNCIHIIHFTLTDNLKF